MKCLAAIFLALALCGCAAMKQEHPKLFGAEEITSEDVGFFALDMAVGMGLWSLGLPDQYGNQPPKFDFKD